MAGWSLTLKRKHEALRGCSSGTDHLKAAGRSNRLALNFELTTSVRADPASPHSHIFAGTEFPSPGELREWATGASLCLRHSRCLTQPPHTPRRPLAPPCLCLVRAPLFSQPLHHPGRAWGHVSHPQRAPCRPGFISPHVLRAGCPERKGAEMCQQADSPGLCYTNKQMHRDWWRQKQVETSDREKPLCKGELGLFSCPQAGLVVDSGSLSRLFCMSYVVI